MEMDTPASPDRAIGQNDRMKSWHMRAAGAAAIAVTLFVLSACSAGSPTEPLTPPTPTPPAASPMSPQPEADPPMGASEAFLAWLAASRVPDVKTACAGLSPDLAARMIAEINATSPAAVQSCEQMIAAAAELYRAVDASADVEVAVQTEATTDATLFVTYVGTGDCGTVVMKRAGTDWIITDESRECIG